MPIVPKLSAIFKKIEKCDPNTGIPNPQHEIINYWNTEIPEIKSKGGLIMNNLETYPDYNKFNTISDFKWCVIHGGEIEFVWKDKIYSITHDTNKRIGISQIYRQDTEQIYENVDQLLTYTLETGEKLNDIITRAEISSRTL